MSGSAERTYFWDFFGPRSGPTATHFKRHLQGFLVEHGVAGGSVSETQPSAFHHAIGLSVPAEHWELIEKALRPKRHA